MSNDSGITEAIEKLTAKASQPTSSLLRQLVIKHFEELRKARSHNVSWQDLASAMSQGGQSISVASLRRYYREYVSDSPPSRQSKKSKKKSKVKPSSSASKSVAQPALGSDVMVAAPMAAPVASNGTYPPSSAPTSPVYNAELLED